MADSKTLRLLLVEDDLEDEQLLREALIEIEEQRKWCNWRTSTIVHVEQLADALDCLRQDSFDALLLNLSLPDSPVLLDSFLEATEWARGAPIVVLADEADENLANLLLREGAQDVLVKSELDCAPLARSLRYAIERQRRTQSLRDSPFVDDLTGTLTRACFCTIAQRYTDLALLTRAQLILGSIEISLGPEERGDAELLLIQAAEILLRDFESPCLVGRIGRQRFGLVTAGLVEITVHALLNRAAAKIEEASGSRGNRGIVHFVVSAIESGSHIEDLLGEDGHESSLQAHRLAKTVMLSD